MSRTEPDPDLVRIGQSPEWIAWFDEALAYFEDQRLPEREWRPIGIRPESLSEIEVYSEKTHVRDELVPLVRASVREYAISHYPWDFRP